jgi:hypothetical protein
VGSSGGHPTVVYGYWLKPHAEERPQVASRSMAAYSNVAAILRDGRCTPSSESDSK